ncbi:Glutathione S-transferase [Candidatus Nitrotoga sp. BS]|uniref:glutathione S-transferase n=1 Tax=Candidatus Nitrotoga sp. BS TaxID=2890408 RepID=UPI001EF1F526|nr:glutathione S-transferase [Candidatus Nitrotoga sp. BS]CAH1204119.1 Glutathione S-transferase [Candidatus Nitrotoga sp. BS]
MLSSFLKLLFLKLEFTQFVNLTMVVQTNLPILYSFRRCPYAIRARLAIEASGVMVELREILLRDKPVQMTSISEKATVPVLVLPDGKFLDESLDIIYWALEQNDPQNLLLIERQQDISQLILKNDSQFKLKLDKYKYAVRSPEKSVQEHRAECEFFLMELEERLMSNSYLLGAQLSVADIAIFPFIRQFASVDTNWFDASQFVFLRSWLRSCVESSAFERIMKKYIPWKQGLDKVIVYL